MFGRLLKGIITILKKKIPIWVLLLVISFGGCLIVYGYLKGVEKNNSLESQSYSIVKKLEKVNEVVFLNAGIHDIQTQKSNTTIPWTKLNIPLTEKKAIIILNYDAKFGIKKAVKIERSGEHKYSITVPKYEVIGFSLDKDEPYKLYDSSGELFSGTSKNIDTGELVSKALSSEKQEEYLDSYKDLLNDSAKNYYTNTIKSVDSDAEITFTFQ